ncbi:hypothetical protein GCM10009665_50110 [Kitasatospora nipponensis]|uniref:Lipoprotein n=1 Tax=Kitasatospora nipponensis TaxID=258049 RepID=A0ABP4H823_9ACTN
MSRAAFRRVVAVLAAAPALVAPLTGCAADHPSAGAAVPQPVPPPGAHAPADPAASLPVTAPSSVRGAAAGAAYRLGTPASAGGYAFHQPSEQSRRQLADAAQQSARQLGLSGTPVQALYDDPADNQWIVFIGYDGTGYDPAHLHAALWQQPVTRLDGTGDRVTVSWQDSDPGPHGGTAICRQELMRSGALAAENTACLWLTPTTFGEISFVPKGFSDRQLRGFTAADVGALMRTLRGDLEQPTG